MGTERCICAPAGRASPAPYLLPPAVGYISELIKGSLTLTKPCAAGSVTLRAQDACQALSGEKRGRSVQLAAGTGERLGAAGLPPALAGAAGRVLQLGAERGAFRASFLAGREVYNGNKSGSAAKCSFSHPVSSGAACGGAPGACPRAAHRHGRSVARKLGLGACLCCRWGWGEDGVALLGTLLLLEDTRALRLLGVLLEGTRLWVPQVPRTPHTCSLPSHAASPPAHPDPEDAAGHRGWMQTPNPAARGGDRLYPSPPGPVVARPGTGKRRWAAAVPAPRRRGCMGPFLPGSQCVFLLRCWVLMPASRADNTSHCSLSATSDGPGRERPVCARGGTWGGRGGREAGRPTGLCSRDRDREGGLGCWEPLFWLLLGPGGGRASSLTHPAQPRSS